MEYKKESIEHILNCNYPKYICLPTNLYVNQQKALLNSQLAKFFKKDLDLNSLYGKMLNDNIFNVSLIAVTGYNMVLSFPTRWHWKKSTNIQLVKRSSAELLLNIEQNKLLPNIPIYLPIQIDGSTDFTLNDLIEEIDPFIKNIDQLNVILK